MSALPMNHEFPVRVSCDGGTADFAMHAYRQIAEPPLGAGTLTDCGSRAAMLVAIQGRQLII